MGRIPPALRIARDNATCRMTGVNTTPQGYYRVSEKKGVQVEARYPLFTRNMVLSEVHCPPAVMTPIPSSDLGSCSRLQDRSSLYCRIWAECHKARYRSCRNLAGNLKATEIKRVGDPSIL